MNNSATKPTYTQRNNKANAIDQGYTLQPYNLYEGVVATVDHPNGAISVMTKASNEPVKCVYAGGIMSMLLGFNTTFTPPVGTQVIVLYTGGDPNYIVGCVPRLSVIPQGQNRTTVDGDSFAESKQTASTNTDSKVYGSHMPANDLIEGELEIGNAAGVALSLLKGLARIQAGSKAVVETLLIDDMVRILSEKFKHHSAFGDHEIYNDGGGINMVFHGAARDFEASGLEAYEGTREAEASKPNEIDPESEVKDKWNNTGRWRMSQYVGYVGNFINMFVSDPTGHLADAAQSAFTSGRFRAHINEDGSFLLQSVGDIVIERVVKIPVPIQIKRFDDPSIELDKQLDPSPLANWIPSDKDKLFEVAYQLRDHARWFSNLYTLAKFHMQDDKFKVPNDSEIVQGDMNNKDGEKSDANGEYGDDLHAAYLNKYATIRVMRDGSIVAMDAYGSSFNMSNRDVTVSAARNLNFEAANHITFSAGNDISMTARRHLELSAITGGFLIRAKTWLQQLCEKGTILLESGATEDEVEVGEGEVAPRVLSNSGVIIKSRLTGVFINTAKNITLLSEAGSILMRSLTFFGTFVQSFKINRNFKLEPSGLTVDGQTTMQALNVARLAPWAYTTTSGSPAPIFNNPLDPITIVNINQKMTALKAEENLSTQIPAITDTFQHREEYENVTEYQSITQSSISDDQNTYGEYSSTIEKLSTIGKGAPYPGKTPIKRYEAIGPRLDQDGGNNKALKNKPGKFTTSKNKSYFK